MNGGWEHCALARSDLNRAVHEAIERVGEWSRYGAVCNSTFTFRSGLSEESKEPDAVMRLHQGDTAELKQIRITIQGDGDAYRAEVSRMREAWYETPLTERDASEVSPRPPSLVDASVTISLPWGGKALRLEVTGPDRAGVEGLFARLADVLTRREAHRRWTPREGWVVAAPLATGFGLLGVLVLDSSAPGLIDRSGEWAGIVSGVIGVSLAVALCWAAWWLYPELQLVEDGQRTRAERFRNFALGAFGALVLALVSSAVYAAIS